MVDGFLVAVLASRAARLTARAALASSELAAER